MATIDAPFKRQPLARERPAALGWTLPSLFIVLWSSGYIAGAIGIRYTEPFVMTTLRFGLAAAILLAVALVTRAPWPRGVRAYLHLIVVGTLLQALQFGGLYSGMKLGVPAGISAIIIGTMPLFAMIGATVIFAERSAVRQWIGFFVGITGVLIVVANHLVADHGAHPLGYTCVGIALAGITSGTLYQKKFCTAMDLRTGGFVQLTVATLILGALATLTEPLTVTWSGEFIGALTWMSLVNSIGAISILFVMIRKGEASRVTGLFHLIPPVTAFMAAAVLHEQFTALTVIGFAVAATGVYLSTKAT